MVHHAQPVPHQPALECMYADAPCAATGSAAGAAAAFEGSLDWLGLDLVAAIRRQQGFMRDMLAARAAYDSEQALGALGVQSLTSHPGPGSSEAHPAGRMIGIGLRAREP